jgi:hypothetical protein
MRFEMMPVSWRAAASMAVAVLGLGLGWNDSAARDASPAVAAPPARAATSASSSPPAAAAPSTAGMSLRGDQEGTTFQSLTVEGEDRVHFEFERPELELDLDPAQAPGLDWGSAQDVLDRTQPDLFSPFAARSATAECPFLARPWLQQLASGPVARFQPQVDQVERWKLVVANSHGETVTSFSGQGRPPREIVWDGRAQSGKPAAPGLTYSYVLEAFDRAGNKRNFIGSGFELSAYRMQTAAGPALAFTGALCTTKPRPQSGFDARGLAPNAPPLLLEAASWLNQSPQIQSPIRVLTTARSTEQANALAASVARGIAPRLLGNPARLQVQAQVVPDACESGTVEILPAR